MFDLRRSKQQPKLLPLERENHKKRGMFFKQKESLKKIRKIENDEGNMEGAKKGDGNDFREEKRVKVKVKIEGRQCSESAVDILEKSSGVRDGEKNPAKECTCLQSYRYFLENEQKTEKLKLRNAPGGRALEVKGSESCVECNGIYVEQEQMRNGKPCFGRDEERGGVLYYCKRSKFWKICQDGHPMKETGWNYSQSMEDEDSDLPPIGLWSDEKKIKRETKRDYSEFRVEMLGMNIKG